MTTLAQKQQQQAALVRFRAGFNSLLDEYNASALVIREAAVADPNALILDALNQINATTASLNSATAQLRTTSQAIDNIAPSDVSTDRVEIWLQDVIGPGNTVGEATIKVGEERNLMAARISEDNNTLGQRPIFRITWTMQDGSQNFLTFLPSALGDTMLPFGQPIIGASPGIALVNVYMELAYDQGETPITLVSTIKLHVE